jgi:hypothetical protein
MRGQSRFFHRLFKLNDAARLAIAESGLVRQAHVMALVMLLALLVIVPEVSAQGDPASVPSATIVRPAPMTLRVSLLEPDTYLDLERRLAVLTEGCEEPAASPTVAELRPRLDPREAELAFSSGGVCGVGFVGGDNAYVTSAVGGDYVEVVSGQSFHTRDCPELASVEPALIRFDRVILLDDDPSVCHLPS